MASGLRGRHVAVAIGLFVPSAVLGADVPAVAPDSVPATESVVIGGPDDGFTLDRRFGDAVALAGDLVFVGSAGDGAKNVRRFERIAGTWTEMELVENDVDNFGAALSLDNGRIAVGGWDDIGEGGMVEIYDLSGGTLQLDTTLTDPTAQFGREVEILGDVLAVLSSDGVHVYRWSGASWDPDAVLPAMFPQRLAVVDGVIAAGSAYADFGMVWMFAYDGLGWALEQTLTGPRNRGDVDFGLGVALDGETLVVASGGGQDRLSFFTHEAGTWIDDDEVADDVASDRLLLAGDLLLLGIQGSIVSRGNSVLLHRDRGGAWTQELVLGAASAIAMDGNRIVLGRPWIENDNGTKVGQVEIVDFSGAWLGASCGDGVECASGHCATNVCCDQSCTQPCQVCTAAAGAPADGQCTSVIGPGCCQDGSDCGEPPPCSIFICDEDHSCRLESTCCESDADCVQQPPCTTRCVEGGCQTEPGCVPDSDSGGSSADGNATGVDDSADGGTSGAGHNDDAGGCGCRHRGPAAPSLAFFVVLWARRRSRGSR